MGYPELETNRLNLVQVKEEHTESFFEIMSKDEVTKYYGMDSLKSLEEASKVVESFQSTYENKRGIRWGIVLKDTGNFVGTLGLNNLSTWSKKAEIGFELHPSHWNKGIAFEAVKEVLRYSFENLELFRIGAVTYPQNDPSIHLLNRLGFTKEGLLRGYLYQNNQSHDSLIFSLLSTEWTKI
ncbi:GNAT family N-acetyltransferase [Pradoshia eiseniae]|uniref:GNAT family N-acetyltransferase n=1 Tax=Pradoshia eiseniae TaxID=2064768 RepID=A0A2S7N0V6_9BACI|nr:GNAT family N-acetyltransferase [Pradoshia eiseniae]PQD95656.1 GNAT family N-acetyltransferase [Pradoshia eiseniae]